MVRHFQVGVQVGPIDGLNLIGGLQVVKVDPGEMTILCGLDNLCVDLEGLSVNSPIELATVPTSEKDGYSIFPGRGTMSLWSSYNWSIWRRTLFSLVLAL